MLQTCWQYIIDNRLEVLAFILSIAGVWFTAKEKVINWPIGIVACIVYTYLFYKDSLFGDAALNVFYVVIGFYGWYEWLYGGKDKQALSISKAPIKTLLILVAITIPAGIIFGLILTHTSSNVPYLDGITTALSLAATWMQARKLIESWLLWIVTDLLYLAPYIIKQLYLTSVLYFIFALLAVYGYYLWKKELKHLSVV